MQQRRIWTAAIAVALVALVAWSAWLRWQALTVSPFPLGVDGYFYPVQLRSLLEGSGLQYPASPLTFYWMAPFAAATDPITGAKLGAAIGCALVALPAYGVAAQLTRQRGAGLVAAAVAAMSATSAYVTIEFVKQGIGLTIGLATVWLVLRTLAAPTRTRIGLAIAGLVVTALAHKLAAGFVLALAVPGAIEEARARGAIRGRRLLYLILSGIALAIVVLVLGIVAPQRFLSPGDLALLSNLVDGPARWAAPALVTPGLTLAFGHEAAFAGVLACIAAVMLALRSGERMTTNASRNVAASDGDADASSADGDADASSADSDAVASSADSELPQIPEARVVNPRAARRSGGQRAVAWGFVVLALAIALPWLTVDDPQGLGFRLRVAAFVPLAICAALVASTVARLLDGWQRGRRPRWTLDVALAALALVLVVRAPHTRSEGRVVPHPAMVTAVMAATTRIPSDTTVIVPERHILFMTAWYTRAPVALRPGTIPYGRRVRLMPLAFIGMGSPLDDALDAARADSRVAEPPLGLHPRHRNGLVLVAEPTWDWLLTSLPARVRGYWARWRTI